MVEILAQDSFQDHLLTLAETNPEQFQHAFRCNRGNYPEEVTRACLLHLAKHGLDQAGKYMIIWLCSSADYFPILLDRQQFSLEAAKRVLDILFQEDQGCVSKLVSLADKPSTASICRLINRALELIDVFTNKDVLIPWLRKLTNSPDTRLRSKAIQKLCELRPNKQFLERQLKSSDERVRAAVLEASWRHHSLETMEFFREALADSNHRVVVNALVGLYLMGDPTAFDHLSRLAEDPSPMVRRAVIWAFGHIKDRRAITHLEKLRDTDKSSAVRNKAAQKLALFSRARPEPAGTPVAEGRETTEEAVLSD